jgi:RNA recognition motif-containing protein
MTELSKFRKLSASYNVFFVHNRDDVSSLDLVLDELETLYGGLGPQNGFGAIMIRDKHTVALCSKDFAKSFNEFVENRFGGEIWMSEYELHEKRLPPATCERTIKVNVPHGLTSIQAKSQLREYVDIISKFVPFQPDRLSIRIPLKDGKHRGFGFLQFTEIDDDALALVKMFLPSFNYTEVGKGYINTQWYEKHEKKQ